MGCPPRQAVREEQLVGFKYFHKILRMLDRLHDAGGGRDRAHNRQLHFDQYTALILLYFFNPILTSLRGIDLNTLARFGSHLFFDPLRDGQDANAAIAFAAAPTIKDDHAAVFAWAAEAGVADRGRQRVGEMLVGDFEVA
jgi:hypothetical protein